VSEALKGRWSALVLVILVVLCAGLAQTSPGHSVLADMGLAETAPSYTELAFTDAGSLPNFVTAERASVSVSFGISNVSGATRAYRWSIVAVHEGTSKRAASGDVIVPAQGHAAVAESVRVTCPAGRDQMVVQLASPAESINFWVACPAVSGAAKESGAKSPTTGSAG
jgi:hypothetical protein